MGKARPLGEELALIASVKARYANGVLTPLESVDLEEGAEVLVSIEDAPPRLQGMASVVEVVRELQRSIPPEAWDDLPADLAMNKKHYLYGHPKEADECE